MKIDYKISQAYNYANSDSKRNEKNVQFGFNLTRPAAYYMGDKAYRISEDLAGMIGAQTPRILTIAKTQSKKRFSFLRNLAYRYNERNFYLDKEKKENIEPLFEVFNTIKKPLKEHRTIIDIMPCTYSQLLEMFKLAKSKKDLQFILNIKNQFPNIKDDSVKIIIDILKSPYKEELGTNPAYVNYINKNIENKNIISELETAIKNKTINAEKLIKQENIERFEERFLKNATEGIINRENIEKYYSESGLKLLRRAFSEYMTNDNVTKDAQTEANLFKIYLTTNKNNYDIRKAIIEKFKDNSTKQLNQPYNLNLDAIIELFEKIDNDKHAYSFVSKCLKRNSKLSSPEEFLEVLNTISPKQADIFYKNVERIVAYSKDEERIQALKGHYNDAFHEPSGLKKSKYHSYGLGSDYNKTRSSRIKNYIINILNKIKYEITPAEGKTAASNEKINSIINTIQNKPLVNETKAIQIAVSEKPVETPTKISVPLISAENERQTPSIALVNTAKELRNARKLKVINDVNEIIKKKLGRKTFDYQQDEYTLKATKMRLKLLPDIFDSLADTRKTSETPSKFKNKEAVNLYSKIKGNNKKLIRYMLLKRKEDGTREFNINDILSLLKNTETQVAELKASDETFKAPQVKALYNLKYEELVDKYGKLKVKKNNTTKKK